MGTSITTSIAQQLAEAGIALEGDVMVVERRNNAKKKAQITTIILGNASIEKVTPHVRAIDLLQRLGDEVHVVAAMATSEDVNVIVDRLTKVVGVDGWAKVGLLEISSSFF